ncbi:hypothetical protein [Streptodolium elevatio]
MTRNRSAHARARSRPHSRPQRVARPVLTALATAAALVVVQLAVAAGRDVRPHFALDLTLGTPVAADGETVTAVVRLTMSDTKPGDHVTVAGRLTGGLRTVGADPSRGGFDGPSGVWTVPTAPGRNEAVLVWRIQATAKAADAVERVRVSVTSPRTRAHGVVVSGSPSPRPSASSATGSAGSAKPGKPSASGKPVTATPTGGKPTKPVEPTKPVAPTRPTEPTTPNGPTESPKAPPPSPSTSPGAASTKPTAIPGPAASPTSTPTPTLTAKPTPPTQPTPTSKPAPTISPTPTAKPTPTTPKPPSSPPPPPPPPPPASEVEVPTAQRCAHDATAACADLRFGKPRLTLARTVDTTDARPGQTLTHTVTVTDSGNAAALFANVRNSLPAGAPLLWGALSQGTYDVGTGVWQTGRIAADGRATLTLAVRVPDPAAGTVMAARSDFVASSDPAPTVTGPCADDPDAACSSTRIAARDARSRAQIPNAHDAADRPLNNPEWGDSGARSGAPQMHAD